MEKVLLSAPFAKTVSTEDGGRELWGWATLEVVDKSGEIADFNGTVKAFEKWSNDTAKRTNGKNLGNVRLMHSPVAVGKTTYWEPRETTIQDDDGNEQIVKGIWVGAYVPPTKPDVIRDIDEGILSAFSIGGSYEKRWWDEDAQAFRYIPQLSEYSIVDNPCVPNANVEQVIAKTDAPWNRKEGGEDLLKDAPKGGDNTMMKGEENKMDLDHVIKAAETAGLNMEQIQAFFKALTPQDQPPAPVNAPTVDGDGDKDDNKEFPNPPEGDEKINIPKALKDSDQSEKDSGVAAKSDEGEVVKADIQSDDNQPEDEEEQEDEEKCAKCGGMHKTADCEKAEKSAPAELEKAGKAISNKNGAHLQHAANHIGAVMKGADYTHEDHLVVESQIGQGNTGEEAPEVDVEKMFFKLFSPVIESVVAKSMSAHVEQLSKAAKNEQDLAKGFTKAVEDIKSLVKGLASQDDLKKAVGELEAVKALVKEIHETPQVGGPILNGGNPDLAFMAKGINQVNASQMEEQALENLIQKSADPVVKDRLSQELAHRKAKQIFR